MKLGYLKLDVQSRPQRPRQLIPREHQSFFKVDGLVKCERWIRDNDNRMEESTAAWWLNRLIGRTKKIPMDWPYTLVEDKLFVLTLSAGQEGYGVSVDGRHVTSFPYRTAYVLKDATGLSVNWDIHAHNIFAGSLPTSHPSFAPQKNQKMSAEWYLFAERMAVRKSWMCVVKKSSNMAAHFLLLWKEVNIELKKEAEFFGDIVIVPFLGSYDLVVLKTVAICKYGVPIISARYIMKCDDNTFVRIYSVMNQVKKVPSEKSLYIGTINYHHKPLQEGKMAVTYEEWPEEDYPPYANWPGYVVSSDIAHFVISDFDKHKLRLLKMEDVRVGMWVEQFDKSKIVE